MHKIKSAFSSNHEHSSKSKTVRKGTVSFGYFFFSVLTSAFIRCLPFECFHIADCSHTGQIACEYHAHTISNVFLNRPHLTINVKNFHGSLTTVVRAQNDTSKTANITDTMFDRTYWYSPYKRRQVCLLPLTSRVALTTLVTLPCDTLLGPKTSYSTQLKYGVIKTDIETLSLN